MLTVGLPPIIRTTIGVIVSFFIQLPSAASPDKSLHMTRNLAFIAHFSRCWFGPDIGPVAKLLSHPPSCFASTHVRSLWFQARQKRNTLSSTQSSLGLMLSRLSETYAHIPFSRSSECIGIYDSVRKKVDPDHIPSGAMLGWGPDHFSCCRTPRTAVLMGFLS